MTSRTVALLASLSAFLAAPAAAQELADRSPRIAANLALGFAGELDGFLKTSALGGSTSHTDVSLDPTVGLDLRGELPVADFLVIGAWFELLGVLTDQSGAEREETFSFDAFARGRWVFEIAPREFFIEPYVLLPIGFSMAVLPDGGGGDRLWPGWNTGVLAGAQFLHGSGFGGYLELGWRHAEVYDDRSTIILGTTVNSQASLVLNDLAFDVGAVYAF
jgi:hypothetical protein